MFERWKKFFGTAPEDHDETEREKIEEEKIEEMDQHREEEDRYAAETVSGKTAAPEGAPAPEIAVDEAVADEAVAEGAAVERAAVEGAAVDEPSAPAGSSPAMQIRDRVISVLKTVYDPEIPVDIYELGLIYGVEVTDDGEVHVTMTLTTPMCPVAETLPPEVEEKVRNVVGVKDVSLDLVWDPPWSVDMMSDAARLELNMM